MAFPFLTGFYSKDLIPEVALGQYRVSGDIAYWLCTISAVFAAFLHIPANLTRGTRSNDQARFAFSLR
jgi:hypothetical protein